MAIEDREAIRRLKSTKGHVRGATRMVKEDKYCIDVVRQIRAIQGTLEKLSLLMYPEQRHRNAGSRHPRAARLVRDIAGVVGSPHQRTCRACALEQAYTGKADPRL